MFKLKYGTLTISNLQNSIAELTFFVFNWIYPFWVNFLLKIKIVSFKLDKFKYAEFNGNINFFSVFEWKYLIWANLVKKSKLQV